MEMPYRMRPSWKTVIIMEIYANSLPIAVSGMCIIIQKKYPPLHYQPGKVANAAIVLFYIGTR
jgi:hypothetical protein